ncbi:hypothetical protein [Amycolatopsis minnesotensis]
MITSCSAAPPPPPPADLTAAAAFADSVRVTVEFSGDTAEKRRAKADKAVTGVLAAVAEKRVQHVDYPANSLASLRHHGHRRGGKGVPTPRRLFVHTARRTTVERPW